MNRFGVTYIVFGMDADKDLLKNIDGFVQYLPKERSHNSVSIRHDGSRPRLRVEEKLFTLSRTVRWLYGVSYFIVGPDKWDGLQPCTRGHQRLTFREYSSYWDPNFLRNVGSS